MTIAESRTCRHESHESEVNIVQNVVEQLPIKVPLKMILHPLLFSGDKYWIDNVEVTRFSPIRKCLLEDIEFVQIGFIGCKDRLMANI